MELEPNSLDWNGNELEHELELEDMKRIIGVSEPGFQKTKQTIGALCESMSKPCL